VISYKDIALHNCYRVIANFVQISLAWQRGSVREKCDWQHSMAHRRTPPPYRPRRKNLKKSCMQAEL